MTTTFNLDTIIQQENKRYRLRHLRVILVVISITLLVWHSSQLPQPTRDTSPSSESVSKNTDSPTHQPDDSAPSIIDLIPDVEWDIFLREAYFSILMIILLILLIVVGLKWLGEWLGGDTKQKLIQRIKSNELILQRVSGMPEWEPPITLAELEDKHAEKWIVRAGRWVVKAAISLLILFGLPRLWPGMPESLNIVLWLGAGLIVSTLLPSKEEKAQADLSKRLLKKQVTKVSEKDNKLDRWVNKIASQWEQQSDTAYGRLLYAITLIATVAVALVVLSLVVFPLIDRLIDNRIGVVALICIGIVVVLSPGLMLTEALLIRRLIRAFKRADFDTAVSLLDTLPQTPSNALTGAVKGAVLFAAGEYEQAQKMVRDELAESFDFDTPNTQNILLITLGQTLTAQGNYEEAIRVLECAILIYPNRHDAYNALAEAYLLAGTRPELALRLAALPVEVQIGDDPDAE